MLRCIFSISSIVFLADCAFAQGHYEANPTPTTKISRSSEHKTKPKEFKVPVEVELEYKSAGCEAKLSLEYFQRGENAQVSSTLTNPQCGASFGSYTVQLRYRGDDGELQSRDYEETWKRGDDEPLKATRLYFIGDDVDLVRVKSRSLTCTCSGGDAAAETE